MTKLTDLRSVIKIAYNFLSLKTTFITYDYKKKKIISAGNICALYNKMLTLIQKKKLLLVWP